MSHWIYNSLMTLTLNLALKKGGKLIPCTNGSIDPITLIYILMDMGNDLINV